MSCVIDEPVVLKQNTSTNNTDLAENVSEATETNSLIDNFLPNLSINNALQVLETLKSSIMNLAEVNESRVAYFKAQIASGEYVINNESIVSGLLNEPELA